MIKKYQTGDLYLGRSDNTLFLIISIGSMTKLPLLFEINYIEDSSDIYRGALLPSDTKIND